MSITTTTLARALTASSADNLVYLASSAGVAAVTTDLQIEDETISVLEVLTGGIVKVMRGIYGTTSVDHAAATTVSIGAPSDFHVLPATKLITPTQIAPGAVVAATSAGSITASKLTTTLATGFIPLDITNVVILASAAVPDLLEGARPDGNTAPSLARTNGATDICFRLAWAAASVAAIQWMVPLPPDLDDTGTIVIHLMLEKDTNTDTAAVVGVQLFQGKGDANAGGNTAALAAATLAEKTVIMAAADVLPVSGAPFLNICVTPGTHGTDAIRCYAAWVTYTRV